MWAQPAAGRKGSCVERKPAGCRELLRANRRRFRGLVPTDRGAADEPEDVTVPARALDAVYFTIGSEPVGAPEPAVRVDVIQLEVEDKSHVLLTADEAVELAEALLRAAHDADAPQH